MKMRYFVVLSTLAFILITCTHPVESELDSLFDPDSDSNISTPVIQTRVVTHIDSQTATTGGEFTRKSGAPISAKGVCWSTEESPTITDTCTNNGSGFEEFTAILTNLNPDTHYRVRAYATNAQGTWYGGEESFTTARTPNVSDIDGNVYATVQIGTQVWMAVNLRTTRYRDGTTIPNVTGGTQWSTLTSGARATYNNASDNNPNYGQLYNWYAVNNTAGLCPVGWHVPTDAEWTTLSNFLATDVGFKMKSTSGWDNNGNGSNDSGFSGLPGGGRHVYFGAFYNGGRNGYFWSSSESNPELAWYRYLTNDGLDLNRDYVYKGNGFSVRCIMD